MQGVKSVFKTKMRSKIGFGMEARRLDYDGWAGPLFFFGEETSRCHSGLANKPPEWVELLRFEGPCRPVL